MWGGEWSGSFRGGCAADGTLLEPCYSLNKQREVEFSWSGNFLPIDGRKLKSRSEMVDAFESSRTLT